MKKSTVYLILTIIGFVLPNYFVVLEYFESGNILFYSNIPLTMAGLFANNYSTAFVIDLLFVVLLFFIWIAIESKRIGFKYVWIIWLLTLLFGIAFGLPLFLFLRERLK